LRIFAAPWASRSGTAQLRDTYGLDYRFSSHLDLVWAFLAPSSPVSPAVRPAGQGSGQAVIGDVALSASMHIRHFGKLTIMCVRHIGAWKIQPSPLASG